MSTATDFGNKRQSAACSTPISAVTKLNVSDSAATNCCGLFVLDRHGSGSGLTFLSIGTVVNRMDGDTIGTADALAFVSTLPKEILKAAMKDRHFPTPEGARQGVESQWDADALVVLRYFATLRDSGMKVPLAGQFATQLAKAMRDAPDAAEFGVFVIRRPKREAEILIRAEPPAEPAECIFTIPIEAWREAILADLRALWQSQ